MAIRFRLSLAGGQRLAWRRGDHPLLYGLWRLEEMRRLGWLLLVEGESDCWTCWHYGIPALGIPGKSTWRSAWAEHLAGLQVFLWQAPDAQELPAKVGADLPGLMVLPAPDGSKDISEAHLQGQDVPALLERARADAIPWGALCQAQADAYHTIDAGSPRVLIYDDADLRHRAAIFAEADSLPAGEDNPAASAVRNLIQNHRLHYGVVIRNRETGDHTVREVDKAGRRCW